MSAGPVEAEEKKPLVEADEKKPLLDPCDRGEVALAYSSDWHATIETGLEGQMKATDYEVLKLSSYRVFTIHFGTVLENRVMLTEQFVITVLFVIAASPSFIFFNKKVAENRHGPITVNQWLDSQEAKMRIFAMIMTQLAAFFVDFLHCNVCCTLVDYPYSRCWRYQKSSRGARNVHFPACHTG